MGSTGQFEIHRTWMQTMETRVPTAGLSLMGVLCVLVPVCRSWYGMQTCATHSLTETGYVCDIYKYGMQIFVTGRDGGCTMVRYGYRKSDAFGDQRCH